MLLFSRDPIFVPLHQFAYNLLLYLRLSLSKPHPPLNKALRLVSDGRCSSRHKYDFELAPMKLVADDDLVSIALKSCARFRDEQILIRFELRGGSVSANRVREGRKGDRRRWGLRSVHK